MKEKFNCVACHLCTNNIKIFQDLSFESQKLIMAMADHKIITKGERLFNVGDDADKMVIVHNGKIKLSEYDEEGKEYIYDIATSGYVIGEDMLFTNGSFRFSAEALTDTRVCIITNSGLEDLLEKDGDFRINLIKSLAEKNRLQEKLIRLLKISDSEERLKEFLYLRADLIKKDTIELTREDISLYVNLSRETVSRKLQSLEKKGFVELDGYIKIKIIKKRKREIN